LSEPFGSVPSLQFDRAEFTTTPATSVTCASCNQSIIQSYYEAGGKTICSSCREAIASASESGGVARFLRALAVGFGAAIVGSIVWWGVRKVSGYEIGLISIGIGIGVGRAVRWGGRNRGGWRYQLLAVLLTYASIAGNYMPDVITEITKDADAKKTTTITTSAPAKAGKTTAVKASAAGESVSFGTFLLAIGAVFLMAAASPFFGGAGNIIGLLIIGFGLWEAWKTNRRVELVINGPYSVAHAPGV
jgi:hypothetical protein